MVPLQPWANTINTTLPSVSQALSPVKAHSQVRPSPRLCVLTNSLRCEKGRNVYSYYKLPNCLGVRL